MRYVVENEVIRINFLIIPILFLNLIILQSIIKINFAPSINSLIYIITFLFFYFRYRSFKTIAASAPIIFWGILTAYHLINASLKHVAVINEADYLHGMKMYSSLCIYTFLLSVDMKKTLKWLMYSSVVWFIFALTTSGFNLRGDDVEGINAVNYGKTASNMCIYALYYCMINYSTLKKVLVYLIIPVFFILLAQTRNAFAMIVFQFAGFYYSVKKKSRLRVQNVILLLIVGIVMFFAIDYVIHNTGLGTRFTDQDDVIASQINNGILTNTIWDKILGERLSYYVYGWRFFLEYPFTGIGLDNYENMTGGVFPMHVEYMVHIAEGGIIGFALFLLYVIALFRVVIKVNVCKAVRFMLFTTFGIILFTNMYASMFMQERTVIIICIILSANQSYSCLRQFRLKS